MQSSVWFRRSSPSITTARCINSSRATRDKEGPGMILTAEIIDKLIDEVGLSHEKATILSLCQPSIRLLLTEADDATIPIGTSKLGGLPDFPPEMQFPVYKDMAISFIGQINLAELAAIPVAGQELPVRSGM